uniref:hAT-like transposase RNase-H fold domain-containing protein n=1 Tax=Chenopodium quinoa TaxID=63459 RepID=A0A803MBB6_CHEQI
MESEATTTSMPVDDEVDESNVACKRKRSRKSKGWREMTKGTNAKDDKVLSLTVDNASYNDVMVKHMKNRLESRGMLVSGGCFFHIRCCAHIINLIVQSGLSCIENILDKIRNLVKFVTRSFYRSKDFYDTAQKHFHLEAKRKLRMDMQVRWNSTYMMLDNVLYYKYVFIHLESLHASFKSNVPLEDEWENLSVVHKFLKLFYDVTCMFSVNRSPTSNMYFKGACMVHRRLLETSKGPHEFLAQMVLPMLENFDKYWSEYNIFLACAAILDPRFELKFVEYCFDKIYGSDEAMCKVEKVLNTLRSLYNEYKSAFSTSPIVAPFTTSSRIEDENFFDDYQSYSSRITRTQTKKSQLESYLEESKLDLNMELYILEY